MNVSGNILAAAYVAVACLITITLALADAHFRKDPRECLTVTQQGSSVLCVTKTHKVTTLATITTPKE